MHAGALGCRCEPLPPSEVRVVALKTCHYGRHPRASRRPCARPGLGRPRGLRRGRRRHDPVDLARHHGADLSEGSSSQGNAPTNMENSPLPPTNTLAATLVSREGW
jgi:hypothetical protein